MRIQRIAVFLIVLSAAACGDQRTTIRGDPPVAQIEFSKHWITITPAPGVSIGDLVDMSLFRSFRPGMTFDRAVAVEGNPTNIRRGEHNTYYEYMGPTSRIEVGREEYSTGDGVGVEWALYAYPFNRTVDEVVIPQIAKHVNGSAEQTGIQIKNPSSGGLALFVYVVGRRVDHLIWFDR